MAKDKRKLTKAEIKRGQEYEKVRQGLLEEGYKETNLTVGVAKANLMVFATSVPIAFVLLIVYIIAHIEDAVEKTRTNPLIYLACLLGVVIHELIHGIGWSFFCKSGWKAISFGIIWKYLTPYCTCSEPLNYKAYIIGGLLPTIILGLVPYIIALVIASKFLLYFSLFLIIGGGGDLYMILLIRKYKNAVFLDHPYEVGCTAFERA